jgi:DNA-directed RNA polymerase specialized sigma24 family protein
MLPRQSRELGMSRSLPTLIGTWSATVKRDASGTTASQDVNVPVASAGVESAFPFTAPRRSALTVDSGGSIAGVSRAPLTPQQQLTLAERIRNHDPIAEEELVRAFSSRIAFLVFVRTRDREAARDLTQDVLMAVVVALRDGHLREPERLAGFVFGTARNVVNEYLRTRSRQPREDPIDAGFDVATIPDTLEDTERAALVRRALGAVDSTDRKRQRSIAGQRQTRGRRRGDIDGDGRTARPADVRSSKSDSASRYSRAAAPYAHADSTGDPGAWGLE